MIKFGKVARRDQTVFGPLDYGLMALGNCLAIYSAGMAVGAPESGQVFLALVLAGTFFSLGIRTWSGARKILKFDSVLYTAATIGAVVFTTSLNAYLPSDGIPSDVTTAGWLCWMLTFGSFLTWRDRTLLFQAVPTIALFGLIGCYDTFAPAPFLFFGFLLCLATLLGRSHSREMLRLAVLSGYFNRADSHLTVSEQPEQSSELYEDIKRGPWRWLAGPEWALLSGLVIVVFSLLGAPVIRQAVEPISGAIKVFTPKRIHNTLAANKAPTATTSYEVGRGPLVGANAPPRAQYTAKLDKMRYLRTSVFDLYTGHGWSSSVVGKSGLLYSGLGSAAIAEMTQAVSFHITITRLTTSDTIPLPAEPTSLQPDSFEFTSAGSAQAHDSSDQTFEVDGVESESTPKTASRELPPDILKHCLDASSVRPDVMSFALNAVAGKKTDFEKANAIKEAIAAQCKYFKGVSPVPQDADAADYFLNTSKTGYCDLFATAMVECARSVNIPAHFVIGFLPDAKNQDKVGSTVIFDQDYHAWAELYFKGVGWVVFDATEGAVSLDPEKSNKSLFNIGDVLTTIIDVLIGVVAIGGVAFFVWNWKKKKAPAKEGVLERAEAAKVYQAFARALFSTTHQRRSISETTDEYMRRISPLLPNAAVPAAELNSKLTTAMYGIKNPGESEIGALKEELKRLRLILRTEKVDRA